MSRLNYFFNDLVSSLYVQKLYVLTGRRRLTFKFNLVLMSDNGFTTDSFFTHQVTKQPPQKPTTSTPKYSLYPIAVIVTYEVFTKHWENKKKRTVFITNFITMLK